MITDCAVYRDGRRAPGRAELPEALRSARTEGGFVWLELHEPDQQELGRVGEVFGLHPLAVGDAVKAHQRPKLEIFEDSLFLVLKPVTYDEDTDTVTSGEIMLFLGGHYLIAVRHGEGSRLDDVRKRLEGDPDMLRKGPVAVVYAVADTVVDHYLDVATKLLVDLEELEAEVFSATKADSRRTASRIYLFKRQILEFQRAASPLTQPLSELAGAGPLGTKVPLVQEAGRPFFRNVDGHLTRVNESVDALDRLVSDILSAHLAQMGVRQNDDMRKISAWAAMAVVPTVIAGIYGMNFEHMPELRWSHSYPVAIAVMLALVALLYHLFKRKEWI
ncbi:magnesium and cobalt transport protein CorA [Streptomyces sp. NPDC032940]|uniref:magnesium and cobalt transport protein CorA n=1 Tax=Streptomyces sp. NPDC032940 TaxID=3155366 RepID=UPI0033FC712F